MKVIKRHKLRSTPRKRILGLVSLTVVSFGLFTGITFAEVKIPEIFGDHMVLQEGTAIVWGEAEPGEKITVTYEGVTAMGEAGQEGKWKVELKGLKFFRSCKATPDFRK